MIVVLLVSLYDVETLGIGRAGRGTALRGECKQYFDAFCAVVRREFEV